MTQKQENQDNTEKQQQDAEIMAQDTCSSDSCDDNLAPFAANCEEEQVEETFEFDFTNELCAIDDESTHIDMGNLDSMEDFDRYSEIDEFLNTENLIEQHNINGVKPKNKSNILLKTIINILAKLQESGFTKKQWRNKAKFERNLRRKIECSKKSALDYLEYLQEKNNNKTTHCNKLQKKILELQESYINLTNESKVIFEQQATLKSQIDGFKIQNNNLELSNKGYKNKLDNCSKYITKLEDKYKDIYRKNHALIKEMEHVKAINKQQNKILNTLNTEHKGIMQKTELFVNEYFRMKFMNEPSDIEN